MVDIDGGKRETLAPGKTTRHLGLERGAGGHVDTNDGVFELEDHWILNSANSSANGI